MKDEPHSSFHTLGIIPMAGYRIDLKFKEVTRNTPYGIDYFMKKHSLKLSEAVEILKGSKGDRKQANLLAENYLKSKQKRSGGF